MIEVVCAVLLITGALFLLLAAIGIMRMPDLLMRMQTATKASTLGVGCVLLAAAVYFQDFGVAMRALLVIVFFFITAPVAAHMIGRAAYFVGVPLWERTIIDELHGRYDQQTHALQSTAPGHGANPVDDRGHAGPGPEAL
jgi:multicomponent Na+:H+ antiporter subunit G